MPSRAGGLGTSAGRGGGRGKESGTGARPSLDPASLPPSCPYRPSPAGRWVGSTLSHWGHPGSPRLWAWGAGGHGPAPPAEPERGHGAGALKAVPPHPHANWGRQDSPTLGESAEHLPPHSPHSQLALGWRSPQDISQRLGPNPARPGRSPASPPWAVPPARPLHPRCSGSPGPGSSQREDGSMESLGGTGSLGLTQASSAQPEGASGPSVTQATGSPMSRLLFQEASSSTHIHPPPQFPGRHRQSIPDLLLRGPTAFGFSSPEL